MAAAPKAPSGISKLLAGLNGALSNPNDAGLMGLAQGLLAASAPHMLTPVSMGQAVSMGLHGAQQYRQASLANAIQQQAVLPFQRARTQEFQRALAAQSNPKLPPAQRADAASIGLQFAGVKPQEVPSIAGQITHAESVNKPTQVAPGARTYGPVGAPSVGAQGAVPAGYAQGPGGSLSALPGGLAALRDVAANQSYGSHLGAYPAELALELAHPMSFAPGARLGSAAVPQNFAPQLNTALSGGAPNAVRKAIGVQQGVNSAAAAAGRPGLGAPAPAVPPQSSGLGVTSGMSLSRATGEKVAQTNATDQLQQDINVGQEAQQRIANLEELNTVAAQLRTGPGEEGHIALLKALAAIPGFAGYAQKLSTITNAQVFNKTALNFSLQTVSGAGQHAYDAFKSVMNAFPELSKTNMANSVVTASLLATARYQADRGAFAANWQKANNGMGFVKGEGSAAGTWTQNAPFMAYFLNALPADAVSMIMQKARTNATLRAEIMQARKGYHWISQNVPAGGE